MQVELDALADVILEAIDRGQMALIERVVGLEVGAGDLSTLQRRIDSLERERIELRERVAMLEVKTLQPGPQGPPGKDGVNGKDGTPGLKFAGVFVEGETYNPGELVRWARAVWICHATTTSKPDNAAAWEIFVPPGRDGKDGRRP